MLYFNHKQCRTPIAALGVMLLLGFNTFANRALDGTVPNR